MDTKIKKIQKERRKKRIRAKIFGTSQIPRLSVFRSNKYISVQLIDDVSGTTLASTTSRNLDVKNVKERAKQVGVDIAEKAKAKKITKVVFDRGGYLYTGSVAAVALGAREAGLKF